MTEGNDIYLVCEPCQKANENDFGVKLAGRTQRSWYSHVVPNKHFDQWLEKHRNCGGRGNPDHFVLAHRFGRNHDQTTLEAAVKLALVN